MANPTTNFGWVMPTATDLVTDLPADFDVFGQAVDTDFVGLKGGTTGQVLAKASGTDLDFVWSADAAGMTNPMTTTADIIYSSSGSTPARLGIGSTDDVLTVAGGVPTWAAPAGGGDFTLLNSGGTALSGTTATTISGISGVNSIYLFIHNASSVNANANITVTFNADTSANYNSFGLAVVSQSTYTPDVFTYISDTGQNNLNLGNIPTDAAGRLAGYLSITGANTTNSKMLQFATGPFNFSGNTARGKIGGGYYIGASTISSLTVTSSSGNFDLGTIYVYTSAV
jgi:hypothetical protein